MKKTNLFFTIVLALALTLSACGGAAPAAETKTEPRTLAINGTGRVSLTPDMATISIGVQTQAPRAEKAVADNTRDAAAIMGALTEAGIAAEDVRTTNFSIYPRQDYDREGNPGEIFYVVNNTVMVTVRDLDNLGSVLDAVVKAGANSINNIQFDSSERESAYNQVLAAAMENAYDRASTLAEASNVTLGDVQRITTYIGGGGDVVQFERAMVADSAGGAVPISAGQMELTLEVQVVYEIE